MMPKLPSISPKVHFYHRNGSGRDLYISNQRLPSPETQRKFIFQRSISPSNRSSSPKVVKYQSDGSGRDHYITLNNGGMTIDTYRNPNNFQNSLRYFPVQEKQYPFKLDKSKERQTRERQQQLSSKLSNHKYRSEPFFKQLEESIVNNRPCYI